MHFYQSRETNQKDVFLILSLEREGEPWRLNGNSQLAPSAPLGLVVAADKAPGWITPSLKYLNGITLWQPRNETLNPFRNAGCRCRCRCR